MPTISLRITEQQKQQWTKNAQGQPLSDWIRLRCDENPATAQQAPIPQVQQKQVRIEPKHSESVDQQIARKSGHNIGCDCMNCFVSRSFSNKQIAEAHR